MCDAVACPRRDDDAVTGTSRARAEARLTQKGNGVAAQVIRALLSFQTHDGGKVLKLVRQRCPTM
jgi:hypothetical protein